MFTDYVLPDGRTVPLSDATKDAPVTTYQLADGSVVYALRADLTGPQDELTVRILELLGRTLVPTFAVRQCSACKDVLGVKDGHGVTHGVCTPCIRRLYPDVAEAVIATLGGGR